MGEIIEFDPVKAEERAIEKAFLSGSKNRKAEPPKPPPKRERTITDPNMLNLIWEVEEVVKRAKRNSDVANAVCGIYLVMSDICRIVFDKEPHS